MPTTGQFCLVMGEGPRAFSPATLSVEAFDSASEGDVTSRSRPPYSESSAVVPAAVPMEADPTVGHQPSGDPELASRPMYAEGVGGSRVPVSRIHPSGTSAGAEGTLKVDAFYLRRAF